MNCPDCEESTLLSLTDENFRKYMESATAEEVSQMMIDFLVLSSENAFDSYKRVLKSCLRTIQRHCRKSGDLHSDECYKPAYFVYPIEFIKAIEPRRQTKVNTDDDLFYGYKLLKGGSSEDATGGRRIPLWIIDPNYKPVDPRLQKNF